MSKRALSLAGVVLALLFVLPTGSAAETTRIALASGVPVKLLGETHFFADSAIVVVPGDAAPTALHLQVQGGVLEKVTIRSSYVSAAGAEVLGEQKTTVEELALAPGALSIAKASEDALLLFEGSRLRLSAEKPVEDRERVWTDASAQLNLLVDKERFLPTPPAPKLAQLGVSPARDLTEFPVGTYQATARNGGAVLERVDRFLAVDATLLDAAGGRHEGRRLVAQAPGGIYVPGPTGGSWMGPGSHVEEVLEYYVVKPSQGSLSLAALRIQAYASDLRLQHEGVIGLPWADGRLQGEDETIQLQGEQTLMGGTFRLRPVGVATSEAPSITLLGEGTLDFLRLGARERSWSQDEVALATGGALATVGLAAAVAYFWPLLKYGASLTLFPLYARVPKEQTLQHKGRELLYDLIRNEPGISTNKLAKDVPFGWSTLTYHLRVLERNEAIVSVRDGRYKRFFDRQSGRFANGRKYVLAVLKNDATYGIAQFIRQKPGSSQKEVAGSFKLSPSSVHWHVERLSEVGLVSKMREAHNVKYFPGEGWDHVTIEDLKTLEPKPVPVAPPMGGSPSPETAAPAPQS